MFQGKLLRKSIERPVGNTLGGVLKFSILGNSTFRYLLICCTNDSEETIQIFGTKEHKFIGDVIKTKKHSSPTWTETATFCVNSLVSSKASTKFLIGDDGFVRVEQSKQLEPPSVRIEGIPIALKLANSNKLERYTGSGNASHRFSPESVSNESGEIIISRDQQYVIVTGIHENQFSDGVRNVWCMRKSDNYVVKYIALLQHWKSTSLAGRWCLIEYVQEGIQRFILYDLSTLRLPAHFDALCGTLTDM